MPPVRLHSPGIVIGLALPAVVRLPTLETNELSIPSPVRVVTHAGVCMSFIQPWK